jgi:2-succinyl-6-hydroxy-2,4-cyclohexadiene-1-carboxylate synthase
MRIVLVPGFTQTAAAWDAVRARLPSDVEDVVAIDVPTGLDFVATAHAIGDLGGRAIYVGYSMGGRLCLRLALDQPDHVAALVLISASPGIADPVERATRLEADERLATELERDGIEAFLERWLAQPLFASLPPDSAGLDARLAGSTVPGLAHALRALGQGAQEPLWGRLGELTMSFVPVAGRLDEKYVEIAARMADATGAHPVLIAGAGHAVHLEQPDTLARVLHGVFHEQTS